MQFVPHGSSTSRKAKVVKFAGNVMATVFWDVQGLLVNYLQKDRTITGAYYSDLLQQLRYEIKRKRCSKLTESAFAIRTTHQSVLAMSTIQDCRYELLQYPPYSPNFPPSDCHLFPRMKTYLAGQHFDSDDEVIEAVGKFLDTQHSDFFNSIAGRNV